MPNQRTVLVSLVFGLMAFTLLATAQPASAGVDPIEVGQKTIFILEDDGATQDDIEYVRAMIVNLIDDSPSHFKTYVEQSTRDDIRVRVYRNNRAVLGGQAEVWPPGGGDGIGNDVRIDLADNDVVSPYLEGFSPQEKEKISNWKNYQTLAHEFGHLNYTGDPQLKENVVLTDIGAGWQRQDYTGYCRELDGKHVVPLTVGTTAGVLNLTDWRAARKGAGGDWPDEMCGNTPVGGVAELPALAEGEPSAPNYVALAGLGAAALLALTAGAWYARRRWLR